MVTSLVVVTGLVAAAVPARAAVSAPSSTLSHTARQAAGTLGVSVLTPPSGDITITLDLGVSLDPITAQELIAKFQGENARLSDTIKREIDTYSLGITGDNTTVWQDFDGTLSMASSGTGLSLTIPASEVQTSANWWQTVIAGVVGTLAQIGSTLVCVSAFPAATLICSMIGGFTGSLITGLITQAFDGTLGDPGALAATFAGAIVAGLSSGALDASLEAWAETTLPTVFSHIANWILLQVKTAWAWIGLPTSMIDTFRGVIQALPAAMRNASHNLGGLSCDEYAYYGTPCAASYSMDRALYAYYDGPLYQVRRASDGAPADIGLLSAGGYVNASEQDSFCADTTCTVTKIYDQSPEWNDLTIEQGGGANHAADHGAVADALPVNIGIPARHQQSLAMAGPVHEVPDVNTQPGSVPAGSLRRQRRPDLDQRLHRRFRQRTPASCFRVRRRCCGRSRHPGRFDHGRPGLAGWRKIGP
jgi:hypothetical protein